MQIQKKKLIPIALVAILMVSIAGVYAWTVVMDGLGHFILTAEQAECTLTIGTVNIGSVGSGYDFDGTVEGLIDIKWAKTLIAEFNIDGLDEGEKAALMSCFVSIGEDLDDNDILDPAEIWGTINCINPVAFSHPLDEAAHDILMYAEGTVGYPASDVPIDFTVTVTVTTP